jgi:hypothetical protein
MQTFTLKQDFNLQLRYPMRYEKHICVLQTSFAKRTDTIDYLEKHLPGITVDFITDSSLLPEIRKAGKPTQSVIRRMTLCAMAAEAMGRTSY